MEEQEKVFCMNCKWCADPGNWKSDCHNNNALKEFPNPVTGEPQRVRIPCYKRNIQYNCADYEAK